MGKSPRGILLPTPSSSPLAELALSLSRSPSVLLAPAKKGRRRVRKFDSPSDAQNFPPLLFSPKNRQSALFRPSSSSSSSAFMALAAKQMTDSSCKPKLFFQWESSEFHSADFNLHLQIGPLQPTNAPT